MGAKTKIIVLHMKEIIYTLVFLALAILLVILLVIMFRSHSKDSQSTPKYNPGVYTSSLKLNNNTLEVEVSVDESHINSIRFANLDESVATAYPLIQPALEEIADQIYESQSPDEVQYSADTPYTSEVIADTIRQALEKAATN
ncbi:MAG: hypothetical protein PHW34_00645 [Hespellia sp.]|nr:hypothetical protein [Hespellia sp.]